MQQRYIDFVIRIMKGQFRIIQCSEREEKETTLFLTTYLSTGGPPLVRFLLVRISN